MKWTGPVFWSALAGVIVCLIMTIVTAVRAPDPSQPPTGSESIPMPATTSGI